MALRWHADFTHGTQHQLMYGQRFGFRLICPDYDDLISTHFLLVHGTVDLADCHEVAIDLSLPASML